MASYREYIINIANSIGSYDRTSAKELLVAYTYGRDLESGIYITGNPDLSNSKSEIRYNNIIKRIVEANPREYFANDFDNMSRGQVLDCVCYVLNLIFGSSKDIMDTFYEFVTCMSLSGSQAPMDGCSYEMKDTDNNIHHEVIIPSITSTSSVVCILHEFAHYYFQKNKIPYQKFYYQEILSILFEKIASDVMTEVLQNPEFVKKIENIRLECINYHYTTKKQDLKELISITRRATVDLEYAQKLAQDYTAYSQGLATSYGLGYIYAEYLFNLYKNDLNRFQQKMHQIFCKQITLQDTLNYYDVNLQNKQVFEQAKDKVRVMTK